MSVDWSRDQPVTIPMAENSDGPYVLHSDHLAAVEEARRAAFAEAKNKFYRITVDEYGEKYGGALDDAVDAFFEWLRARAEGTAP